MKVLSNIITYEKGVPQDGHIEAAAQFGQVAMRVSIYPTIHGEKAVVRILDSEHSLPELATLTFGSL